MRFVKSIYCQSDFYFASVLQRKEVKGMIATCYQGDRNLVRSYIQIWMTARSIGHKIMYQQPIHTYVLVPSFSPALPG